MLMSSSCCPWCTYLCVRAGASPVALINKSWPSSTRCAFIGPIWLHFQPGGTLILAGTEGERTETYSYATIAATTRKVVGSGKYATLNCKQLMREIIREWMLHTSEAENTMIDLVVNYISVWTDLREKEHTTTWMTPSWWYVVRRSYTLCVWYWNSTHINTDQPARHLICTITWSTMKAIRTIRSRRTRSTKMNTLKSV